MNAPLDNLEIISQQVHAALEKTDSKNTKSVSQLQDELPLIDNLAQVLEVMAEARQIMTARIMREGVMEDHYWASLLGNRMPDKVPGFRIVKQAPVLRTTNQPDKQPVTEETKPMEPADNQKPRSLVMLEYIQKHPGVEGKVLRDVAGTNTVDAYIIGYLKRGEVIKTGVNAKKATYRLADGTVATDIYLPPSGNRGQHNKHSATGSSKDIANNKTPNGLDPIETIMASPFKSSTEQETPASPIYGPFRMAYTNDDTLIIYGFRFEPIELTTKQTEQLRKFLIRHFS